MHATTYGSKRLPSLALIALLGLTVLAGSTGCQKKEDRWQQAASSAEKAAETPPSAPKAETGSFNKFFPKDGTHGASRTFTADKEGYAEAKLSKDGKEIALLAVTDLNGKDADKAKFASAAEKVEGYPVATFGKNKTMILVKDRYQVSASSQTLDHEARKSLISKFDLRGLSAL